MALLHIKKQAFPQSLIFFIPAKQEIIYKR